VIDGIRGPIEFTLEMGVVPFTVLVFVLGFFMSLGKAAVYKHIPVYYPDHVGSVGGMVGMIGALGGFVLPIAFGVMNDWIGIWTTSFMLLFVITAVSLLWMHFAIRRMDRQRFPQIKDETDLPEIMSAAGPTRGPC
jgi:NNP family nitrate/nitrite transporter-like MFS transporter